MTMPHSDRPRRNRVNQLRERAGLPPLEVLEGGARTTVRHPPIVSMMIPLAEPVRVMLGACHLEAQRRHAETVPTDALFASALLTAAIMQAHQSLFPPVIAAPTAENMAQAKQIDKVVGPDGNAGRI